jgi:hypothetical protein
MNNENRGPSLPARLRQERGINSASKSAYLPECAHGMHGLAQHLTQRQKSQRQDTTNGIETASNPPVGQRLPRQPVQFDWGADKSPWRQWTPVNRTPPQNARHPGK